MGQQGEERKLMKTVWIVDDNQVSIEGIQKFVDWGAIDCYVTRTFTEPERALAAAETEQADIIISDVCMPGISGFQLVEQLLRQIKDTKIIMISAYSEFEYAKTALRLQVFDYVEKPIDFLYLQSDISRAADAIDKALETNEMLGFRKSVMSRDLLRQFLLETTDTATFEQLKDRARNSDIDTNCKAYLAVEFVFQTELVLRKKQSSEQSYAKQKYFQTAVERAFHDYQCVQCLKMLHGMTLILGTNDSPDTVRKQVLERLSLIFDALDEELKVVAGVGSVVSELWAIKESFEKANLAYENRLFMPGCRLLDGNEQYAKPAFDTLWCSRLRQQIKEYLKLQLKAGLRQVIHKSFNSDSIHTISSDHLKMYIYSICGEIMEVVMEQNIDPAILQKEYTELFSLTQYSFEISVIRDKLLSVAEMACDLLCENSGTYNSRICSFVEEYISLHYSDCELSLKEIAQHAALSPRHLCAVFKSERNLSVSQYITQYRLEKASEYLKQQQFTVRQISENVGYANQFYFSSSFKKQIGKTPSQYRQEYSPYTEAHK